MTKIIYEVVEHDGGWAYRVDGAFSESFPSHSDALEAAKIAASAQQRRVDSDQDFLEAMHLQTSDKMDLEIVDHGSETKRFSPSSHG